MTPYTPRLPMHRFFKLNSSFTYCAIASFTFTLVILVHFGRTYFEQLTHTIKPANQKSIHPETDTRNDAIKMVKLTWLFEKL